MGAQSRLVGDACGEGIVGLLPGSNPLDLIPGIGSGRLFGLLVGMDLIDVADVFEKAHGEPVGVELLLSDLGAPVVEIGDGLVLGDGIEPGDAECLVDPLSGILEAGFVFLEGSSGMDFAGAGIALEAGRLLGLMAASELEIAPAEHPVGLVLPVLGDFGVFVFMACSRHVWGRSIFE